MGPFIDSQIEKRKMARVRIDERTDFYFGDARRRGWAHKNSIPDEEFMRKQRNMIKARYEHEQDLFDEIHDAWDRDARGLRSFWHKDIDGSTGLTKSEKRKLKEERKVAKQLSIL